VLAVRGVHVRYGRTPALQGVSLTVGRGEVVGVIGPNGAGKSTLLATIAGLLRPIQGDVTLENESLVGLRTESIVRRGLALVPEGRHIFSRLTVEENLHLGLIAARSRGRTSDQRRDSVLDLFPVLRTYLRSRAGMLSGGEQQQLALARAVLAEPTILLLDEPSLGLAPLVVERVWESLTSLRDAGMTLLLVEQNAARTFDIADRVYVMNKGTIQLSGTAADLLSNPEVEAAYFGHLKLAGEPR
jgi:branched-chain amino acid transport system ATP-binding protein